LRRGEKLIKYQIFFGEKKIEKNFFKKTRDQGVLIFLKTLSNVLSENPTLLPSKSLILERERMGSKSFSLKDETRKVWNSNRERNSVGKNSRRL